MVLKLERLFYGNYFNFKELSGSFSLIFFKKCYRFLIAPNIQTVLKQFFLNFVFQQYFCCIKVKQFSYNFINYFLFIDTRLMLTSTKILVLLIFGLSLKFLLSAGYLDYVIFQSNKISKTFLLRSINNDVSNDPCLCNGENVSSICLNIYILKMIIFSKIIKTFMQ